MSKVPKISSLVKRICEDKAQDAFDAVFDDVVFEVGSRVFFTQSSSHFDLEDPRSCEYGWIVGDTGVVVANDCYDLTSVKIDENEITAYMRRAWRNGDAGCESRPSSVPNDSIALLEGDSVAWQESQQTHKAIIQQLKIKLKQWADKYDFVVGERVMATADASSAVNLDRAIEGDVGTVVRLDWRGNNHYRGDHPPTGYIFKVDRLGHVDYLPNGKLIREPGDYANSDYFKNLQRRIAEIKFNIEQEQRPRKEAVARRASRYAKVSSKVEDVIRSGSVEDKVFLAMAKNTPKEVLLRLLEDPDLASVALTIKQLRGI